MEKIPELTRLIRTDEGPYWSRLRELLWDKKIDPSQTALAVSFENDENCEYGVLVTADERVVEFEVIWPDGATGDGVLGMWVDITTNWSRHGFAADIEWTLSFVREEGLESAARDGGE